jgi:FtsP/CotA-like multicopper oxidase with cupredoxin domain
MPRLASVPRVAAAAIGIAAAAVFCLLELAGNPSGQVHFLAYAENDRPIAEPMWLDTVNVPCGGSVDVIMDFTDPVIGGMSVFHSHLLNHEDKGMMAKIVFE